MEQKLSDNSVIISKPQPLPYFSIIISTYNRAYIIMRALDSLLSQTEKDWEAIVVDDESTDSTLIQILPYLTANHKIRYIRKTHSGEALSKNAGINSATGQYISFLDSDDEYDPSHLQSRKAILMQDSSVKFLYGGARIIGHQYVPDRFDNSKKVNLKDCVIGGTFFIERNLLLKLKGFSNINLGTDADLFDRVAESGALMKETKIPTYIYHYENEDSITNILLKNSVELQGIFSDISPQ
jgi:glycosyltransferase involved in cell wall biosynthesis